MFDAALVCVMRLAATPLANCDAVRAVRSLIFGRAVTGAGIVIQAQHPRLSRIGGSDAKLTEVAASGANEAVSPAGRHTSLGAEALSKISPVLLGENSPLKRQCLKVPRGTCVEGLQGRFCERGCDSVDVGGNSGVPELAVRHGGSG